MTFAALPVGARSMALFLAFQIFFTTVPIIVVFPVPAYPFSKKTFCFDGEVIKLASCCKPASCFIVGSKETLI